MDWKILYSDDHYSDEDGPPENAPKIDVQAIIVRDTLIGRRIEARSDYYIWVPSRGGWRGVDTFGLFDYLATPGSKIVLFGRVLSDPDWRSLWTLATQDPDFPIKSSGYGYEPIPRRSES